MARLDRLHTEGAVWEVVVFRSAPTQLTYRAVWEVVLFSGAPR